MRKGLPKSDLQLTQKGLTAKTRRELRAQRKKQVAEAEQRELDLAVEHFFRVADTVNDHRAIVRDGWGVDHGYTSVSFSSPSRKSDLTIEQQQNIIVKKNKQLLRKKHGKTKQLLNISKGGDVPTTGSRKLSLDVEEKKLLEQIRVAYKKLKNVREGGVEIEEVGNDRAILVSYNLPFSLTRSRLEEYWTATPSHLANGFGVNALEQVNFQWAYIGWPGVEIQPSEQISFRNQLLQENDYSPVFLKDNLEQLCRDFCYRILHPVLHSTSLTTDFQMEIHDPDVEGNNYLLEEKMWTAYVKVMQQFADVIKEMFEDGDVIWLNGYQMMYLPKLIRQILPNCTIGYSLLAPFPTSELFRVLPRREELLHGLLSCDLLGFQSHGHARHFSSTCMRILGLTFTTTKINYFGQNVHINILPMGVDLKATAIMQRRHAVKIRATELKKVFEGNFVFLSVGRPDLDGGIMHGLFGYEEFLKQYSNTHNKRVIFVQIALVNTVTEGQVGKSLYRRDLQIESSISRVVGRINSNFAVMGSRGPVYYLQHDPEVIGMDELYALYEIADCIISTPLRGGLTLVPAQYMLCRHGRKRIGTVVISEFTASAEGMSGALRVNPFDTEGISKALNLAVKLDQENRMKRSNQIISFVKLYTAHRYLKKFSTDLLKLASRRKAPNYMRKLDTSDLTQFYLQGAPRTNKCGSLPSSPSSMSISELVNPSPAKSPAPPPLSSTKTEETHIIHQAPQKKTKEDKFDISSNNDDNNKDNITTATDKIKASLETNLLSLSISKLNVGHTKVIILDYEGVLVEPKSFAELEIIHPDVLNALKAYGNDPNTELFIFSNRKKEWMNSCFKGINCTIAAESGFYVSWAENNYSTRYGNDNNDDNNNATNMNVITSNNVDDNNNKKNNNNNNAGSESRKWERQAPKDANDGWIEHFKPIFEYFTTRTPGSFIIETENTLAWQYKNADLEHGERNALSLQSALLEIIVGWRVRLVQRTHCVELRLFGVFKQSIIEQFCRRVEIIHPYTHPAILCILSGENHGDSRVFKYVKKEFPNLWKPQNPVTPITGRTSEEQELSLSSPLSSTHTTTPTRGLPNIRCTVDLKESEANYYVEKQSDVNYLLVACAN